MKPMISLKKCSRWYGMVLGLNDINLEIGPGITALIGQNGAGKSTFMKLVTGSIKPTTGTVTVFGMDPFATTEVFNHLGYCPEIDRFYETMSGRQFVIHMGRLQGLSAEVVNKKTSVLMETLGMTDRCDRAIAGYSKGMRQRIKLAQALIHDPEILLLDEPLNGLDPVSRKEFMAILGGLADQGKAVIVSSHILYEVEELTKNIILLHRGRLMANGNLRQIRELIDQFPHKVSVMTKHPVQVAQALLGLHGVISVQVYEESIELEIKNAGEFYPSLCKACIDLDLPIQGFVSPDNNLESLYGYLVGN